MNKQLNTAVALIAIRGDITIGLWGMGTLYIDWGKYYLIG